MLVNIHLSWIQLFGKVCVLVTHCLYCSVWLSVTVTVPEALVLRIPTRRPWAHHKVNPYPGASRQNETEMFSDYDKTSPSIAGILASLAACSMLMVQQQKRLLPVHRLVRGTTRLPHEARSVD